MEKIVLMKSDSNNKGDAVAERRLHERRPFDAMVRILWAGGSPEPAQHRIEDFSLGGFRIRSADRLAVGTRGFALKVLPEGSRLECWVEVVWCEQTTDPDPARSTERYEAGVRFVGDSQPMERPVGSA